MCRFFQKRWVSYHNCNQCCLHYLLVLVYGLLEANLKFKAPLLAPIIQLSSIYVVLCDSTASSTVISVNYSVMVNSMQTLWQILTVTNKAVIHVQWTLVKCRVQTFYLPKLCLYCNVVSLDFYTVLSVLLFFLIMCSIQPLVVLKGCSQAK